MALNFPPQPQQIGNIYEGSNGVNYVWDGVKWVSAGSPGLGNFYLGNLYITNQTINPLNEDEPIEIAGNVIVGNLTSTGNISTTGFTLDSHHITIAGSNLFIDGNPIVNNTAGLTSGDYNLTLYPNGSLVIPGTISSSATGIPEFNSSTDLNLNAANRVNITNSPLNLARISPNGIIGKPGDLIFDNNQIKTYVNGTWETVLRTQENDNVRLPVNGAYQRADGVRAAWQTEILTDISQLTDTNNLLTNESITLQNIDIDGGGAYSTYEVSLQFADGGFGSSRFGVTDTVFDGAGAGSGYTNSLNGGGA
jgi:hypothetical protein